MTSADMHGPVVRCPAVLISAPASGQGKTTITAALARLHARQGRKVCVFKCGPDFLDPYWHELASGNPVHSVDLWMTGEADVRQRLHEAAQSADLILVEGVMGLFDGNLSAADLAQRLGLPVLAVIDASAMAGTFGALAYGLQHYQPGLRWAGMLANRVATQHHADLLHKGLRDPQMWLGAMPSVQLGEASPKARTAALLPERHLGLIAAHELSDALQRLDTAADALARTPLGQRPWSAEPGQPSSSWQDWCVDFAQPESTGGQPMLKPWLAGKRIAIGRDAAFSFIYRANLDCLQAMGAELCFFSPLAGDGLPDCDALWLPGGYPELHAAALSANTGLRDAITGHVKQGKPLWAECGGMLALCESVTDLQGHSQPLWGVLPGRVVMQSRLGGLGMQQLALPVGLLRGHTFHYSRLDTDMQFSTRSSRPGAEVQAERGEAFYESGSVRASYFHAWFASCPAAAAWLFGATIES
ncbi:cobyrinate a,c-diamide synthase [Comamonas resistens]|uniref:Cobyrinate a,c-diamide synthase n=1 Tax=Comamonas resistens TaxID=3046670 RepID=A0ABY8SXD5_9BURK|nr:cobyrinate a,c-diamide synthase [Comamonas resistens]MDL5037895.1 cobyrinate a,c-diamide synthase [Comamonas resistens]WHS67410.1 cobyrinate a,c-diamide synthase [Comamonas resistens]